MIALGIILFVFGLYWAAFKGRMVWEIAHDIYNGGGAPTLDFPIFCPIPIAWGASLVLSALGKEPFPNFGLVAYIFLAVAFGFLLWLFGRLGEPERKRQAQMTGHKNTTADEPTD